MTRNEPAGVLGERAMLQGWLDYHRATLLWKCADLTPEQLATASVPPSKLTLHGLVRHMAEVERFWFRQRLIGEDVPDLYCSEASPDGDFDDLADADWLADERAFRDECVAVDAAVAASGLDDTFVNRRSGEDMSLRWIYTHLIEEYARHNGHADLIRERIDGATGD